GSFGARCREPGGLLGESLDVRERHPRPPARERPDGQMALGRQLLDDAWREPQDPTGLGEAHVIRTRLAPVQAGTPSMPWWPDRGDAPTSPVETGVRIRARHQRRSIWRESRDKFAGVRKSQTSPARS